MPTNAIDAVSSKYENSFDEEAVFIGEATIPDGSQPLHMVMPTESALPWHRVYDGCLLRRSR